MSFTGHASSPKSYRSRSFLLQLGMMTDSFIRPYLGKGKRFDDAFWEKTDGRNVKASMEKVMQGIRLYQIHPYERHPARQSIVWSDGSARLVWFAAKTRGRLKAPRARILVIPSLINGPEILDILPDRSLVRYLAHQGFDVYLLDWGNVREDPELATLESAISVKLGKVLAWLQKNPDGPPLVGMGYCMGGVFLAAADILYPEVFSALTFIATPWDFKAGGKGGFPEAVTVWAKEGLPRVAHLDQMPAAWLQMIFAGVDPSLVARKFSAFSEMKMESAAAELFVAVEDWVNGGADLPAGVARQAVSEWYLENKPCHGKWEIAGVPIQARKIKKPSLVIVPARDKIVPPASARALVRQLPNVWVLEPDCGHISMMVGASAKSQVWTPTKNWILSQV